jgi:hexosaminidase
MKVNVNKATGKNITLSVPPLQGYQGNGAFTLVDGIINEMGLSRSGELLGFRGKEVEALIDLGTVQSISNVVVHTLNSGGSRIYPAHAIEVYCSADGKTFQLSGTSEQYTELSALKGKLSVGFTAVATRFVKIIVKPLTKIPEGRPGAGEKPLYFLDELEVN